MVNEYFSWFMNIFHGLQLYKNVFSPEIGQTLAFIGFVQPASGGVLTMSETQARWFAEMCQGHVKLPGRQEMERNIEEEKVNVVLKVLSFNNKLIYYWKCLFKFSYTHFEKKTWFDQ